MAVKLGMVMKLAVLALLLAAVSATARSVDLFDLLASNNPEAFQLVEHEKPAKPCCDKCVCTKSIPPKCRCTDIFTDRKRCVGCKTCICALIYPEQCRCVDVKDYCLPKCKTTTTVSAEDGVLVTEIASSN